MSEGSEVRIRLLHIHALQPTSFLGGDLDRARTLDQNLSRFPLCFLKTYERRVCFRIVNRAFHRYQKLVRALRRCIYFQSHQARLGFRGIERSSSHTGDFVTCGYLDLKLRRFALNYRDISEDGHPHLGFTDRNQRFRVREEACFARHHRRNHFASCPPERGGLPGNQRGLNCGVTVFRFSARNQPRTYIRECVIPWNH